MQVSFLGLASLGVAFLFLCGDRVVQAMGKRRADFSPQELAQYMRYCANDVDLTYQLFKKLRKGFPVSELLVIDQAEAVSRGANSRHGKTTRFSARAICR